MEAPMDDPVTREEEQEQIPLGQRLYDRPMLLLVAGIVIMAVFYTGWGMWEVLSLTPSPLP
jgi:predicted negative regulator of RcsB-dependent stress response